MKEKSSDTTRTVRKAPAPQSRVSITPSPTHDAPTQPAESVEAFLARGGQIEQLDTTTRMNAKDATWLNKEAVEKRRSS